jgi:dTDP-4-dehydrorhamnose 3,5-epimerase
MQIFDTSLRDVKRLRPQKYGDERGWFSEVFNAQTFTAAGLPERFVQDNQSFSQRGVLRGLHYQLLQPQGKLIRSLSGHIWDVAVDLRPNSPDFGKWAGFHLRGEDIEFLSSFSLRAPMCCTKPLISIALRENAVCSGMTPP